MTAAPALRTLEDLVPRSRLLGDGATAEWAVGGGPAPEVVAFPRSVEELAGLMARASGEGWRVVPVGAGTWREHAAPATPVDLVVSTMRLEGDLEYEPADLTATAPAGTILGDLDGRARRSGQWLPLDPPGWRRGTLGGLVATASAGPLRMGYGTPRDHVLGLTAVTGGGDVIEPGGKVVKNVAGFDLVKLLVGSDGALGVIAAATVRFFPVPERDLTLLFPGSSLEGLVPLARALATAPLPLAAVELVNGPASGSDGPRVAVRVLGSAEAVDEVEGRLRGVAVGVPAPERLEGGASAAFFARLESMDDDATLTLRLALLPANLAALVSRADELADELGRGGQGGAVAPARVAVHASEGILRLSAAGVGLGAAVGARIREIRSALEDAGGSLRVLLAPPSVSREVGPASERSEGTRRIHEALRAHFDPAGILCSESVYR